MITNLYQFIKMTALSFIFIGISLINIISGNKNMDTGILTIPSSAASSSSASLRGTGGSSLSPLSNFPEFFLFRKTSPFECTDENCLNDKLENNIINQISSQYDDTTYGQDYDWNKSKPSDYIDTNEIAQKRNNINYESNLHHSTCACHSKFVPHDLGTSHFPRFLVTAICQNEMSNSRKCRRGSQCKGILYKVRVLTHRSKDEDIEKDDDGSLPESLRPMWKFIWVDVNAGCQCSF